jgi:alpha-1,3-glucosyltransferase
MAPAVYRQIQRPSHEGFLWCMACVSTSFFLFSFQVSFFLFTYGQLE